MMGLSPRDLYELDLCEFYAIYEGWMREREERIRNEWERTRWSTIHLAALQMRPTDNILSLFPLPWDKPTLSSQSAIDPEDIEARRKRAEELLAKIRHE